MPANRISALAPYSNSSGPAVGWLGRFSDGNGIKIEPVSVLAVKIKQSLLCAKRCSFDIITQALQMSELAKWSVYPCASGAVDLWSFEAGVTIKPSEIKRQRVGGKGRSVLQGQRLVHLAQ